MAIITKFNYLFLLLIFISGCTAKLTSREYSFSPILLPHKTDLIVLEPSFENFGHDWLICAREYFDDPIVIIGHGTSLFGTWCQVDGDKDVISVYSLARALHQIYPKRDIILVVCNPDKSDLDIDRVYYPKGNAWVLPDKFASATAFGIKFDQHETVKDYGDVGDISEFYCNKKIMSVKKKTDK